MRHVPVAKALTIAAAVVAIASSDLSADDDLPSQVAQLFQIGESHSPQWLADVERHYRAIQLDERHSATVNYAYALVLIERHRLREAEAVLSDIRGGDVLAITKTKIWVELELNHRQQALADLKQFVERLGRPTSDHGDAESFSAAGFLGRIVGYLAGPGAGKLPAGDLEALRTQIQAGLAKPLRAAFGAGQKEAIDRFAGLKAEYTAALQQAENEAAQSLANAQQEHTAKEKWLDDERQKLDSKLAKRSAKAAADIRELDGKLVQAVPKLAVLYQSIGMLQLAQQALTAQFRPENVAGTYLSWNAGAVPNKQNLRQWTLGQVFVPGKAPGQPVSSYGISAAYFTPRQWTSTVQPFPGNLRPGEPIPTNVVNGEHGYARSDAAVNHNQGVEAALLAVNTPMRLLGLQAAPLQVGVNALLVRRADVVGRQMHGLERATERGAELGRQAKLLDRSARQARSDARHHVGKARARASDLTALKTYVEIPLEREKQRVLAALEAP